MVSSMVIPSALDSFSTVPAEHLSSAVFPEQMSESVAHGIPLIFERWYLLMFLSDITSCSVLPMSCVSKHRYISVPTASTNHNNGVPMRHPW